MKWLQSTLYPLSISYKHRRSDRKRRKELTAILKYLPPCTTLNKIVQRIEKNIKIFEQKSWYDVNTNKPDMVTKWIDEIIPFEFFGTKLNRRRFRFVVKRILKQAKGEYFFLETFRTYDLDSVVWLRHFNDMKTKYNVLLHLIVWVLDHIVKPLIRHFFKCVKTCQSNAVTFYPKNEWNKFQDLVFNQLLKKGHLIEEDSTTKPRGMLILYPKDGLSHLNYRPILSLPKATRSVKEFYRNHSLKIRQLAQKLSERPHLGDYWLERTKSKQLFGVKLDLKDAFGNVDIDKLVEIIDTNSELSHSDRSFLINHVRRQFVKFRRRVYKWTHGLLQGDRLSSALCDLYISHVESVHSRNYRFVRTVDDYFYCSDLRSNVERFESELKQVLPVNASKTQRVNSLSLNGSSLVFYGHVLNLRTLEIGKFYDTQGLRYHFKYWTKSKIAKFKRKSLKGRKSLIIRSSLVFRNSVNYLLPLYVSTEINGEIAVLGNYFRGMSVMAFKFHFAVQAVSGFFEDVGVCGSSLHRIVVSTVKNFSRKVLLRIDRYKGKRSRGRIDFEVLLNIGLRAFFNVLKLFPQFYKHIVDKLRKVVHKVDFRKFSEHADFLKTEFCKLPLEFRGVQNM